MDAFFGWAFSFATLNVIRSLFFLQSVKLHIKLNHEHESCLYPSQVHHDLLIEKRNIGLQHQFHMFYEIRYFYPMKQLHLRVQIVIQQ